MRKWLYSLLLVTLLSASPAWATWREASSKHFVIYSEQPAKSLQEFAEKLELYDKGLRFLFHLPDDRASRSTRVTVFIVPNIATVQKLHGSNGQAGVEGFYNSRPGDAVAFVPRSAGEAQEFSITLQHEYAHHFMSQNSTIAYPIWFSEGFAEFASTAQRKPNGSLSLGLPANDRAYGLLEEKALPIEKLLEFTPGASVEENDKFYGRSWLLYDYLFMEPPRRGQINTYLDQLNAGKSNLEAARAAFGDLKQLDRDLDAYLRRIQSRMTGFVLPAAVLPISAVTIRDLSPGESAMMGVRIVSKSGVGKQVAAKIVAMAREAAAPFPNDAAAQIALAEAEFDAGNYAEAAAAADRALTADPNAVNALIYKGEARIQQAMLARKQDAASWTEIRKLFLAANHIDSYDPRPLSNFFCSYLDQGIEPTPNALAAGVHALEFAPDDSGLRLTLVRYYLQHDKEAEARRSLQWLTSDPHDASLRETASAVIAALNSGGASAALAVFDKRQLDDDKSISKTG